VAPIPAINYPGYGGAFFAMNAATGQILWSMPSDGAVMGGAAVVDGTVYWGGGGYSHLANAFGITGTPKLFAFALPKK
jgi:polyvinyl alcohol dehydrogenase (cytochrome)